MRVRSALGKKNYYLITHKCLFLGKVEKTFKFLKELDVVLFCEEELFLPVVISKHFYFNREPGANL